MFETHIILQEQGAVVHLPPGSARCLMQPNSNLDSYFSGKDIRNSHVYRKLQIYCQA